jgi:hypothetical protein
MRIANGRHVAPMGGLAVEGKPVTLKGELTGANCHFSMGLRGHRHASCSKACVSQGSPVVFIQERSCKVYFLLTAKDGRPMPGPALDPLGRPGVTMTGKLVGRTGLQRCQPSPADSFVTRSPSAGRVPGATSGPQDQAPEPGACPRGARMVFAFLEGCIICRDLDGRSSAASPAGHCLGIKSGNWRARCESWRACKSLSLTPP